MHVMPYVLQRDLPAAGSVPPPHSGSVLTFSSGLNPRQRAILHLIAEESGLQHSSSGEGSSRRIAIGAGVQVCILPVVSTHVSVWSLILKSHGNVHDIARVLAM